MHELNIEKMKNIMLRNDSGLLHNLLSYLENNEYTQEQINYIYNRAAVIAITEICDSKKPHWDIADAHRRADDVLLFFVSDSVREAYERLPRLFE